MNDLGLRWRRNQEEAGNAHPQKMAEGHTLLLYSKAQPISLNGGQIWTTRDVFLEGN
jgi:hypothetical protein